MTATQADPAQADPDLPASLRAMILACAAAGAIETAFSAWVIYRGNGPAIRNGVVAGAHGTIVENLPELIIVAAIFFVQVVAVIVLPLMARRAVLALRAGGAGAPKALSSYLRLAFYMALIAAFVTLPATGGPKEWFPAALGWSWWALRAVATLGLPLVMLGYLKNSAAVARSYGNSFFSQMGDSAMRAVSMDGACLVLLMLGALVMVVFLAALPSMRMFGLGFLTSSEWRPNTLPGQPKLDAQGKPFLDPDTGETAREPDKAPAFGALPVIYGTTVTSAIAVLLAVPTSFGAAIFLVRIAPLAVVAVPARAVQSGGAFFPARAVLRPLLFLVRVALPYLEPLVSFLIEFLAAIPSIAYGIWGLFVLGPLLQTKVEPVFLHAYLKLPQTTWPQLGLIVLLPTLILLAGWIWIRALERRPKGSVSPLLAGSIIVGTFLAAAASLGIAVSMAYARTPILTGLDASLRKLTGGPPNLAWLFNYTVEISGHMETRPVALTGYDLLCGSLVLAIMIVPIITAISRDVLRAVPRAQTEGTTALGATWWQSSREMLNYSRSGLFGAVMLGLARAAGETMAVTMVIGGNMQIKASPFMGAQTMSSLLATQFAEANDPPEYRSALFEVALILLVMSLAFNIVARYLVVGRGARSAAAH